MFRDPYEGLSEDDKLRIDESLRRGMYHQWRLGRVSNTSNPIEYSQLVLDTFGSALIAYYPLDETSGTVVYDRSGNGRNGAYVNSPTLANAQAPSGKLAPLFTGASAQYINLVTSGLQTAWPGQEGSISFWVKADSAARWDNATDTHLFISSVNASNAVVIQHQGATAKSLRATYLAGTTLKGGNYTLIYPSSWVHVSFSWSKAADQLIIRYNGAPTPTITGLGTWTGTPITLRIAAATGGAQWTGWLADWVFTNRAITDAEAYLLASSAPSQRIKRIAYIGDSITAESTTTWVDQVQNEYLNGAVASMNHAIAGTSIIGGMASQAALCATDNAHIIYVALGANDDNAGNMTTLRATYEAGLDTMQASNPSADMKLINVWPLWEADKTTPKDKSNIRAMIDAVGTARGLTVLQPFSEAWYTGADTSDGVHPAAAGSALIKTEIITGLPT